MERLAGRIILLWGWRRALLAFGAGALLVLTQPPFDFFAAGFVSFTLLVWLIDGAVPAHAGGLLRRMTGAFAVGWWFGFGYFLAGLWWIGSAFLVQSADYAWALPIAVGGLPVLLALFYGLATALSRLVWSDGAGRVLALAFGFGLAEWLRTFVLTGFPWNAVGYAAMPIPTLMQSAWVVSMTGMNALTVLVFALPALLAARRHRVFGVALGVLLVAAHAGFGAWRLTQPEPEGKALAVRIVQPVVPMNQKWDASEQDRVFSSLVKQSGEKPAEGAAAPQLIVWPETSVPFLFTERPDALSVLGDMLADGQMLLAGAVREEEPSGDRARARYYNSVVAVDDGGQIVDAVDKVHLVPFGEYLPLEDLFERFGLTQIVAGPMNFDAGTNRHLLTLPGGTKAAAFVCYEVIFPDEVAEAAGEAGLIVNVTNDAWFGLTPGPYQHLRQAQLRAVETGRPVVRAANNGVSAVIDARGKIVDALDLDQRGTIDASVTISEPQPHFAPPDRVGYGILAGLFVLAGILRLVRRREAN